MLGLSCLEPPIQGKMICYLLPPIISLIRWNFKRHDINSLSQSKWPQNVRFVVLLIGYVARYRIRAFESSYDRMCGYYAPVPYYIPLAFYLIH